MVGKKLRRLLFVFLFVGLVYLRLYLDRQTEQVDKARCVRLVVYVVLTEGSNLLAVQRIGAPNTCVDDVALVKL